MRIPTITGLIKRRLLVNFRADPQMVQNILPQPFRPKLHAGHAIVGICLIRLEQIRPRGIPKFLGLSSENAAHRIAVDWTETAGSQTGVFIPRRDTESMINALVGGRVFPGEHQHARFRVIDNGGCIDFSMKSRDQAVSIRVIGEEAQSIPSTSCFRSLSESSSFFESGSLGYSVTKNPNRLDGLRLSTLAWKVGVLAVSEVRSSYFDDTKRFPKGSIEFDHALIMRDIPHTWHQADDLQCCPVNAGTAHAAVHH